MTNLMDVVHAIYQAEPIQHTTEKELQDRLETILTTAFEDVQREVIIDEHSRIDFIVEGIGIEVKIKGTTADVARQLRRYGESGVLEGLILVTTRYLHGNVPNLLHHLPIPTMIARLTGGAL